MEKDSIFRRVLWNNILIMLVPVLLILSVLCGLVCHYFRETELDRERQLLAEYTKNVRSSVENAIQKTNSILKYNYIVDNLDPGDKNMSEQFEFSNNMTYYMDTITNEQDQISIFVSNDRIYENKYIMRMERLENHEEILKRLNMTDALWEQEVGEDRQNNRYLTFYRQIGLDQENILRCRICISAPASEQIQIINRSQNFGDCLTEEINEQFFTALEPDHQLIRQQRMMIIFLTVLIFLFIGSLMVYVLYRQMIHLTGGVEEFIDRLGKTDLEQLMQDEEGWYRIKSSDAKELQVMKTAIYRLAARIKEVSRQAYEIELEKKNLELNLLQSQINPHTLYNSLSAIQLNAFLKKDEKTLELVENMVAYYHAVLNRGKDVFTLWEETDMLRKYIKINEISHGKEYHAEFYVEDGLKNLKIAHLFLQPFVENSVLHGMIGRRPDCRLRMEAVSDGEDVLIRISDNGYGMDEEKLAALNDLEHYDGSYGIKNAYRRMKLLYGENSSIHFASRKGEGTMVEIRIRKSAMQ